MLESTDERMKCFKWRRQCENVLRLEWVLAVTKKTMPAKAAWGLLMAGSMESPNEEAASGTDVHSLSVYMQCRLT